MFIGYAESWDQHQEQGSERIPVQYVRSANIFSSIIMIVNISAYIIWRYIYNGTNGLCFYLAVFKPIFATAKICINPNAEMELKSPKVTLHLEVEKIALEMTKPQVSPAHNTKSPPFRHFHIRRHILCVCICSISLWVRRNLMWCESVLFACAPQVCPGVGNVWLWSWNRPGKAVDLAHGDKVIQNDCH